MSQIIQHLDILNGVLSLSSTAWTGSGESGIVPLKLADYDGTINVYLEVVTTRVYTGVLDGGPEGYVRVFDKTNNVALDGLGGRPDSTVTTTSSPTAKRERGTVDKQLF